MTGEAPPWIIINQFSGLDPGYAQIWILRFGMAQHSNLHQWMEIWCFQQETQVHWYPPSLMVKSPIYNINGINPSCFSRLNGSNHVKYGNMMVKRPTTVWCLNPIMWLKQCNKPAMTGNGLSIAPTKKCFSFSGGWCVYALIIGNLPTKNFGNLPNGWCLSHAGMTEHFYWIKPGHLDPSWHHPVGISPPRNEPAVTRAPELSFQQFEINPELFRSMK